MTPEEARKTHSEVDSLFNLIEKYHIELNLLPSKQWFSDISFREIEFRSADYSCIIPVDDEYNDANSSNPPILLQLVLHMCYEFEDCEDFLVWSKAYSLVDASDPDVLDLYRTLGNVVPKILDIIGREEAGVSDFDWELDAGAAQALRKLAK